MQEFLNSNQVMRALNISRATLNRYIEKGWLTRYKDELRGENYFDPNEVEELKRRAKTFTPSPPKNLKAAS